MATVDADFEFTKVFKGVTITLNEKEAAGLAHLLGCGMTMDTLGKLELSDLFYTLDGILADNGIDTVDMEATLPFEKMAVID